MFGKAFNRLVSFALTAVLLAQPLTAMASETAYVPASASAVSSETDDQGSGIDLVMEPAESAQDTDDIASDTGYDLLPEVMENAGAGPEVKLTGIKLTTESVRVGKGEKVNLEVIFTPKNVTNREVEWSSNNASVASVDKNGMVEARSNGNAVITATAKSGGFKATCNVTVSDKAAPNVNKLDFGGNQSVTPDKKVPLVGGKPFKLALPEEIPVTCIVEDGRVKIGINIKKNQLYSYNSATGATTTMKSKSTKEQIEDLEKNIKKASNYASADKWIKMVQEKKFDKAAVPGITKDVNLDIIGYAEGKWGDKMQNIEGSLIIRLMGTATVQGQYVVWVIPVTVNCTFTASATLSAKIGYNFEKSKWYGDLSFAAKIGIEPYAGVGFGKWLSAGIYGNATTEVTFTVKSTTKTPGLDKWTLSGEAGVKAYFALMQFKTKIVSGSWTLYERNNSGRKSEALSSAGPEVYPDEICAVGAISEMALPAVGADGTIVENAYPAANPEIITAGNTTMLLYVKNVLSGNVLGYTDLVYRLYDSATGEFGEIKSVSKNPTSDCEPEIYTDKNDIYVAWLDSNLNLSEDDDLYKAIMSDDLDPDKALQYMRTFGIRVSKYDHVNDTFVDIGTPSWNDNYIYSPELCMTDEGLNIIWAENTDTAPWIRNHSKEDFVTSSSNILHRSVYSEGGWTEKESITGLDDISDLTIGNTASGLEIAYVIDKEEGQTLYVRSSDGKTSAIVPEGYITTLSYETIPSLMDKGEILTMNMEGGLYYMDSGKLNEIVPVGTMCGDSDYEVYENRIYYLQGDQDSRNVAVSVWDSAKNSYGSVFLTNEDGYVDSFSNQTGTLAYLSTDAAYDEGKGEWKTTSGIKVLDSLDRHDYALSEIDYSTFYAFPGMELPVDMYIENKGTDLISEAEYIVTLDGTKIGGGNIELDLLPGEIEVVEKTFTVPEDYMEKGGVFTVSVKAKDDCDPGNDSQSFTLMKANLTVSSEKETRGNRQYVVVYVENRGLKATNFTTKVTDENGKVLFTTEKKRIEPFEVFTYRREYTAAKEQTLTIEASGDAEEFYEGSNIDWLDMDDVSFAPGETDYDLLPGEVRRLNLNSDGRYIYGVKWTVGYPDQKQKGCISLKNGVVTAKKAGKATVSANYGSTVITYNVNVDGAVPESRAIPSGKKALKIAAPKTVTLTKDAPDKTVTKKVNISIPKELRSADVTISANILKDKGAFGIKAGPVFNNPDRTKASRASFELEPKDAGACYVMWSAKDKDGKESTAYTKVIVKKTNHTLSSSVAGIPDLQVGDGAYIQVYATPGNTDPRDPAFSVKGKGFKVSRSGFVVATLPGASGTVTAKSGKYKVEVQVRSAAVSADKPYLTVSKPFVSVKIPKASSKKDASVALKLATPKKDKPEVVWRISEYDHKGVTIDDKTGKVSVSGDAAPGCYTVVCEAKDENPDLNTAVCEITLK